MVSLVTNVYALFSLWDRKIMQFTDKIVTPQKDDLTLMDTSPSVPYQTTIYFLLFRHHPTNRRPYSQVLEGYVAFLHVYGNHINCATIAQVQCPWFIGA